MKIFRTVLIGMIFVMAALLWATKATFLPSMSAFANANNVIFYILMHSFAALSMFFNGAVGKRPYDYVTGFGMILILMLDMYDFPKSHNIVTALTFVSAGFGMIYYCNTRYRPMNILLFFIGSVYFLLGLWTDAHLFLAEAIAMFCIGVNILRRIWISYKA